MKPFKHQKDGVKMFIQNHGVGAFFWDVGCGKTFGALQGYTFFKECYQDLKMFIVCPISLIESAWIEDIEKFTKFSYSNLRGKAPDLSADIILINFETLTSAKFKEVLKQIVKFPNIMGVIDESQRIKNHESKTTEYLLALSRFFKFRLILSATPAPNSKLEYYSQMDFLIRGMLGSNFHSFRTKFFCLKRGKDWMGFNGLSRREMGMLLKKGYSIEVKPESGVDEEISKRMSRYCHFVDKREALDLPDEIDTYRCFDMSAEQKRAFKEIMRDLVTHVNGTEVAVEYVISKIAKARQIASGFMYDEFKNALEFKSNPKMKELDECLSEIGNKKVIIFCQYQWEIEHICKKYGNSKALYGKTKDRDAVISWFKGTKDGYLVAHPKSAGVGLSFNDCDYMVFYSYDHSYMDYHQSKGRIVRAGKKNNATFIHLVAKDSFDGTILSSLKEKHSDNQFFKAFIKQFKKRKKSRVVPEELGF